MSRRPFLPVFLASFCVTVSLLAPGAIRAGERVAAAPAPAAAVRG